jgi:hypothetical protein
MKNEKTFVGFKLFKWQADVHKGILKNGLGTGHIHVCKSKRQVGKTQLIIGELLYFSLNFANTINGCISPTLNQARKIYKDILKGVESSGAIKKKNDSLLEITFINGSQILFKSAEQKDSLRGYTYTGLLCIDECAYINDEVFSIIKPSTDVHRCPILLTSTPKFRVGFFFEFFQKGIMGTKGISSYDFNNYDTSMLLSKESLEIYKQMLPKNQFLTEYMGEFMDSDSSVFCGFKECIYKNELEKFEKLFVGLDWGSGNGNDDTSMVGINERGEEVFLIYFNNKNTTEQIEFISEYLSPYIADGRLKKILAERNGIGAPLVDLLTTKLGGNLVEGWLTSNDSKTSLVNSLQVAFEQKKIALIDDEKQTAELSMYEATYSIKTGNVSYNAPTGAHDDICIALMLAWECKKKNENNANYSFIFL